MIEEIAASLRHFGGVLRCHNCKFERRLDGRKINRYLSSGWPQHCGMTMEWVTQRLLDEEAFDGR